MEGDVMTEGRWEFFIRIAEECDTMRRHSGDFASAHLEVVGEKNAAALLAYHLRQAYNVAQELAGPRPGIEHVSSTSDK